MRLFFPFDSAVVTPHRSYIDFLIVSYMCFACNLPLPYIAAGEDFLGILFVRWIFRESGAFFIRRSFAGDQLVRVLISALTCGF
jgi:glycerone phosphate O-acyltransferase